MQILDYITEDDLMIFISQSLNYQDSQRIFVLILDRDENFIIAKIIDENKRKMTLKFTLNDVFVMGYENLDINDNFYLKVKLCWQSYLYLLFNKEYLDKNEVNDIVRIMYEYIGFDLWPLVKEKDILIRKI